MKELTQVNVRDKEYLKMIQELADYHNIPASDVVKLAIAEKYRRDIRLIGNERIGVE